MTDPKYAKYNTSEKGRSRSRRYRASHSRTEYAMHWRATTSGILSGERQMQKRRLNP